MGIPPEALCRNLSEFCCSGYCSGPPLTGLAALGTLSPQAGRGIGLWRRNRSPSPRLRGEGRGEGRILLAQRLTPARSRRLHRTEKPPRRAEREERDEIGLWTPG